ncbi:MAG: hypothetical protein CMM87_00145 [Rickettsiales bacterium]|nr:hypothetical protein [Rickettsiales bacterium]|tara:strand:- start:10374 stop:10964 length:591 start_codon:yes stop_codon:yes gene_type:complete
MGALRFLTIVLCGCVFFQIQSIGENEQDPGSSGEELGRSAAGFVLGFFDGLSGQRALQSHSSAQEEEQGDVRASQPRPLRLVAEDPQDQEFDHCPTCICCPCCVVYGACFGCCFTYAKAKEEGLKWHTPCDAVLSTLAFSCFGMNVSLCPNAVATSLFYNDENNPFRSLFKTTEERRAGSILIAQRFCLYPEDDDE